tara:strand:+ start:448 stop:714 length:267 start_codon:yes stop_codon:yes gene_type:complete
LKKNEKIILGGWLGILIAILLIVMTFSGCNGGWSVAGIQITPSDSIEISYLIIIDQDSSQHWYEPSIEMGDNYCYKHHIWEDVRKKSE